MAIQDDILSMFRRIGDAGDRATRRGEAGMAILNQLTPMERMQLSSMYNPEQFSSLEEAMTFNPLIGNKARDLYEARVVTGVEPDELTSASSMIDPRVPATLPTPGPTLEGSVSGVAPDIALDTITLPDRRGLASLQPTSPKRPLFNISRIPEDELDYGPMDPLTMADRAAILKNQARQLGKQAINAGQKLGRQVTAAGEEAAGRVYDFVIPPEFQDRPEGSIPGNTADILRDMGRTVTEARRIGEESQRGLGLDEALGDMPGMGGRQIVTPEATTRRINRFANLVLSGEVDPTIAMRLVAELPDGPRRLRETIAFQKMINRLRPADDKFGTMIENLAKGRTYVPGQNQLSDPNQLLRRLDEGLRSGEFSHGGRVRQAMIDRYNRMS